MCVCVCIYVYKIKTLVLIQFPQQINSVCEQQRVIIIELYLGFYIHFNIDFRV